ncbi:DUF4384 domain-containing protein [Terasakiella sp. SH-1]|uniref:DUF4384 domain-containing protein n=1 Tax=Terasakiella sp. SH-1 TaxID=2560057 RepID=UPI00107465F8|nr:DUF4384 domain-containing protein [Terasakiella sp. SH-1]
MGYLRFICLVCALGVVFPAFESMAQQNTDAFHADKPWRKKPDEKKKKAKKKASDLKKFKTMARDLLGRPHWSERFLNLLDQEAPKIAVHPFKEDELPISLEEAQIYVDGFTRALVKQAGDRYAIVGRKELGAVIHDINEMGTRSDSINPLGDLISRARSDLLAVGELSLKGEKIILSYKLVETETGRIVSASQKSFKRKAGEIQEAGGLSLNGAAQKAASVLMRDVVNPRKIMVQGLRYQTSGVHTSFGRYFMGTLGDAFRRQGASGPRNINDFDISEFVVEEEQFRGLKLASGSVESHRLERHKRDYVLKGTYWVFDQWVEVRLTLIGQGGTSVSWRGRVIKSEIPANLDLIPPPAPIEEEARKPIGPMNLYLSSNKGENPLFKVGQKMVLALRVDQDAYVSCYYLQADHQIFRIFPNPFVTSHKMNGGFTQKIPAAGMPFSFEFTPPTGVEAVKCFALDRDALLEVGRQIGKAAFEPLSLTTERELTKVYRSLPNVALSEASLIVTVQ